MDPIKFIYDEWKQAEKSGDLTYAKNMKEAYRKLVMKKMTKPHHYYHDKLKMFPMINLN